MTATKAQLRGLLVDDCSRQGLPFDTLDVRGGAFPHAFAHVDTEADVAKWAKHYGANVERHESGARDDVTWFSAYVRLAGCSVFVVTPRRYGAEVTS